MNVSICKANSYVLLKGKKNSIQWTLKETIFIYIKYRASLFFFFFFFFFFFESEGERTAIYAAFLHFLMNVECLPAPCADKELNPHPVELGQCSHVRRKAVTARFVKTPLFRPQSATPLDWNRWATKGAPG